MIKKILILASFLLFVLAIAPRPAEAGTYCLGTQCGSTAYNCNGYDCQWYEGTEKLTPSSSDSANTGTTASGRWVSVSLCGPDSQGNAFCDSLDDSFMLRTGSGQLRVTITARSWNSGPDPDERFDVTSSMWSGTLASTGPSTTTITRTYTSTTDITFYFDHRPQNAGSVQAVVDWVFTPTAPTATPTPAAPAAPTNITVVEGDANGGSIIQTRSIRVTWEYPDGGTGCGPVWSSACPNAANRFYIRTTGPSSSPQGQVGSTLRTYTTGTTVALNGAYTVNVCAHNGTQETCASRTFNKVPYPTGALSGEMVERSPNTTPPACFVGTRAASSAVTLSPSSSGYSTSCVLTPSTGISTSYRCTVQLDNQNFDPNPNQTFTVQFPGNQLYSSVSCGNSCVAGVAPTATPTPTRTPTPSPTPVPVTTTVTIDDNITGTGQNQFEYVGGWQIGGFNTAHYQNYDRWTGSANNNIYLRFTGTQVKLYSIKGPWMGMAAVSIDGGPETTVDYYQSSFQYQALLYTSPTLSNTSHTLRIRSTGIKNASSTGYDVAIDKAEVTQSTGTPTSTPTPTPAPVTTTVTVDDAVRGTGQNQFEYVGAWQLGGFNTAHYQNYDYYTDVANNNAYFRFTGTQIRFYAFKGNYMGIFAVSIDGGPETLVDAYNSSDQYQALLYTSPTLSNTSHTLRIRTTGTKNASSCCFFYSVDKVEVTQTVAAPTPTPTTVPVSATTVTIDDNITGTGQNQFEYVGGWLIGDFNSGHYQNRDRYTNAANYYAYLRFTGTQVRLYSMKSTWMGISAVSIDGGPETMVDSYQTATEYQGLVYTSPTLSNTSHTLRIRSTGTKNASSSDPFTSIDKAEVTQSTTSTTTTVQNGLTGGYYNNKDFTAFVFSRVDSTINRPFTSSAPEPGVSAGTWSARWTGYVVPQYTQTYTFYAGSDDGQRLYVNNQLLINDWIDHGYTERSATIALTAGVPYPITYEYYDNIAGSQAALSWSSASQAKQIIPSSRLYVSYPYPPTPTPTLTPTPTTAPTPTTVPNLGPIACTNVYTPVFDANVGPTTTSIQNLYFNLNTNAGFYKVKNLSYYDRSGISSLFPVNDREYDSDDLPLVGHFSRGDDGTNFVGVGPVMTNGTQTVGEVGATNSGVSPRGWRNAAYPLSASSVGTRFIDYMESRKEYTPITSLTDPNFTSKTYGSFLINGNLTITSADAAAFNSKNVVLAVSGQLNINTNIIPTGGNVAFVAQSIYINQAVTEVRALIVGDSVSLVSSGYVGASSSPLKIVGVINSGSTVDTTRRSRTDSFRPSLFITLNPDVYTALLPIISVLKYEWNQLQ